MTDSMDDDDLKFDIEFPPRNGWIGPEHGHYILGGDDGHTAILFTGWLLEWAKWFEVADRRVAETLVGYHRVSTVFLGLDHNHLRRGPPLVFETMVFNRGVPAADCLMERCSTWDEAVQQHAAMVRIAARSNNG